MVTAVGLKMSEESTNTTTVHTNSSYMYLTTSKNIMARAIQI